MPKIFTVPSLRQLYSIKYDERMLEWRRLVFRP